MFTKKPKLSNEEQIIFLKKQKNDLEQKLKTQNEKKKLEEEITTLKKKQFDNSKLGKIVSKIKQAGQEVSKNTQKTVRNEMFYKNPQQKNSNPFIFDEKKLAPNTMVSWGIESEFKELNKKNKKSVL